MKKLIIFLILLFAVPVYGADITINVDTDVVGGLGDGDGWENAYSSLSAAEAAEQTDLVTDGDTITFLCRGATDDTPVTFSGWTTGASNYITIRGDLSTGIWDNSAYTILNNDSAVNNLNIQQRYIRVENIQFDLVNTATRYCISDSGMPSGGTDVRIGNCILRCSCSGVGGAYAVRLEDSDTTDATIYNSIVYDFVSGTDIGFRGIQFDEPQKKILNSVVTNCYRAAQEGGSATHSIINSVFFNNGSDTIGSFTASYSAGESGLFGSGTGNVLWTNGATDWNANFEDYTINDYRVIENSDIDDGGTDDPGSGLYSDDIAGETRVSAWDIGAFEYVATGPADPTNVCTNDGDTVTTPSTTITGTATADTGQTISSVTIPGETVTADDGAFDELSEAWSSTVDLSVGLNNFTATATDNSSNTGQCGTGITLTWPDPVNTCQANDTTVETTYVLTGTVTTNTGGTITGVTIPGETVTADDGTFDEQTEAWSSTVSLSVGLNSYTATATDSLSATDDCTIEITRNLPDPTNVCNNDGDTVYTASTTITGTATADAGRTITGVAIPTETVTADDGVFDEQEEAWSSTVSLSVGLNTFTATATDSGAATGACDTDITRSTGIGDITVYVDTDVSGGLGDGSNWDNAYASLSAAEAANEQDLTSTNKVITFLCKGTTADAPVSFSSSWVMDATRYVIVRGDLETGLFDDQKYTIENDDTDQAAITISTTHIRFEDLQVNVVGSGTNSRYGILVTGLSAGTHGIQVGSCLIQGTFSGTGSGRGISVTDTDVNGFDIYNTAIYGFKSDTDAGFRAVYTDATAMALYNCVIASSYYGLYDAGTGTYTITNCAVIDNDDDTVGGDWVFTYTVGDDVEFASGTGNNRFLNGATDWDNNFENYLIYDYTLVDQGYCRNRGTADPGSGLFSDDIAGTSRTVPWDIGIFDTTSVYARTIYVDTDVVGGDSDGTSWTDAYAALSTAEAAEQDDLEAVQDTATFLCRGATDDSVVTFTGWTTASAYYINVTGDQSAGIWSDSVYTILNNDTAAAALVINENYFRLSGIQIDVVETSTNSRLGVSDSGITAGGTDIRIGHCIIRGQCSGTGTGTGISLLDTDTTTATIYNTSVYGFLNGVNTGFKGIDLAGSAKSIYNSLSEANYIGIAETGANSQIITNCTIFNNTDDINGTDVTITYSAGDDTEFESGTGNVPWSNGSTDWNANFQDYTTNDYRVIAGADLIGAATFDPGSGLYDDDITGRTRMSPWEIGAFEYFAGSSKRIKFITPLFLLISAPAAASEATYMDGARTAYWSAARTPYWSTLRSTIP